MRDLLNFLWTLLTIGLFLQVAHLWMKASHEENESRARLREIARFHQSFCFKQNVDPKIYQDKLIEAAEANGLLKTYMSAYVFLSRPAN